MYGRLNLAKPPGFGKCHDGVCHSWGAAVAIGSAMQPSQPNPNSPADQSQPPRASKGPNNEATLGYAVGSFVGHLWQAIKTPVGDATAPSAPVSPPASEALLAEPVVRSTIEESEVLPDGRIVLRRTTIEEVEIRPGPVVESTSAEPPSA